MIGPIDEGKLQRANARKRAREALLTSKGLCNKCARRPIRKSESGKSKLCDECHNRQVVRMRIRNREERLRNKRINQRGQLSMQS